MDAANIAGVVARVEALSSRAGEVVREAADVREPLLFGRTRASRHRASILSGIRADAKEAADLLGTLPQDGPVTRLRETMQAVADVRTPMRSRTSLFDLIEQLRQRTGGLDIWTDVHELDDATRASELERIRALGMDGLTTRDWRLLSGILDADDAGRLAPELPRKLQGQVNPIVELARSVGTGGPASTNTDSPWFVGRRYFAAWEAGRLDPATRASELERILSSTPRDVSREDWGRLAAILEVDPGALRAGEHTRARTDLLGAAHHASSSTRPALDELTRWHLLHQLEGSPQLRDAARAELRDVANEPTSDAARSLLELDRLDLVGITGDEARAIRIRNFAPTDPTAAEPWLADVSTSLHARELPEHLQQVRAAAADLVELNQARLAGTVHDGYGRHPDYAELGRIRSIMRLLDATAMPRFSEPTPVEAPAAASADTLAW